MRRICALLLTAAFGLGVVGCGETAPPAKKEVPPVKKVEDKEKKATETPPAPAPAPAPAPK